MNSNLRSDLENEAIYSFLRNTNSGTSAYLLDVEAVNADENLDSSQQMDPNSLVKMEPEKSLEVFSKVEIDQQDSDKNYNLNFFDKDIQLHPKNSPNMNTSIQNTGETAEDSEEVLELNKTVLDKIISCSLITSSPSKQEEKSYKASDFVEKNFKVVNEPKYNSLTPTKASVTSYSKKINEDITATKIFSQNVFDQKKVQINNTNFNSLLIDSKFKESNSLTKDLSYGMSPNSILSEITQTTAKVSIGNTTISVPLLKPVSKSKYIQETVAGNICKKNASILQPRKIVQQTNIRSSSTLSVNHGTKINPPTIVSLSQIHIKPLTNTKIVQATVVSSKLHLQSSIETSTQSSLTPTLIRAKPNFEENFLSPQHEAFVNSSLNQNSKNDVPLSSHRIKPTDLTEVQKNILQQRSFGCDEEKSCNISTSLMSINNLQNTESSMTSNNNLIETTSLFKHKTNILLESPSRAATIDGHIATTSSTIILPQNDIFGKLLQKNNTLKYEYKNVETSSAPSTISTSAIYTSSMPSVTEPILTPSILNSLTSSIATSCNKFVSSYSNIPKTISLVISKSSLKQSTSEITPVILRTQGQINRCISDQISKHNRLPNANNLKTTEKEGLLFSKSKTLNVDPISTSSMYVNTNQYSDVLHYKCEQKNLEDTLINKRIDNTNEQIVQDLVNLQTFPHKTQLERTNMDTCEVNPKLENSEKISEKITHNLTTSNLYTNLIALNSKNHLNNSFQDIRLNNDEENNIDLSLKVEDSPNILLKQLLKNSPCSNSHSKSTLSSATISACSQVISSRKLINVRAPSLGLVSSLEAQLARPVIPPVSASTELSSNCLKSEPLNKKNDTNNMLSDCKTKQPMKVLSKETSFVSNPKLCSNNQTSISEGSPIIHKTLLTVSTDHDNNSNHCASPSEKKFSPLYEKSKTKNISVLSSFDGLIGKRDLREKLKLQSAELNLGRDTKELLISRQNEIDSGLLSPINEKYSSSVHINCNQSEATKSSTINLSAYNVKCNGVLQTIKLQNSNSILGNACSSLTKDTKMNKNNIHMTNLSNNETVSSSTNRNLNNFKTEDVTDIKKKKKRKRDYNGNHTKEDFISSSRLNFTKKRLRKCLKVDEDYDIFMDNLVVQMKNMTALNVLEPHLRLDTTCCNIHDPARNQNLLKNRCLSQKFDDDKNNLQFLNGLDFYERETFGFVKNASTNNIQIQNDFYDQEFLKYSFDNEKAKIQKLLNSKKCCNFDFAENIYPENYRSNTIYGIRCELQSDQGFPGLTATQNTDQKIGRHSPIIPFIKPVSVKYDSLHDFGSSTLHSKNFIKVNLLPSSSEMDCDPKKVMTNNSNGKKSNLTVILTVSSKEVLSVLKELGSILKIRPISSYRLLTAYRNTNIAVKKDGLVVSTKDRKSTDIQDIFNGLIKFCRNCGVSSRKLSAATPLKYSHWQNPKKIGSSEGYFCQKACLNNFMNKNMALSKGTTLFKYYKNSAVLSKSNEAKKSAFKYFNLTCPSARIRSKRNYKRIENFMCDLDATLSPSFIDQSLRKYKGNKVDILRFCSLCKKKGDDICTSSSRLLNVDVDRWVHLNCALWSHEVNELTFGGLVNVENTLNFGDHQVCCVCQDMGATIKCSKSRCDSFYHLLCAKKKQWMFNQNNLSQCQSHHIKSTKGNELSESNSKRRVYVERDDKQIIGVIIQPDNFRYLLRVGSVIYLNIGQLLPHQLKEFHTANFIYPVGYKAIRFYWSMKYPNKRCRYLCTIAEAQKRPEFIVTVQDQNESSFVLKNSSPNAVWKQILEQIMALQCQKNFIKIFPKYISGDELFGLNEPRIVRLLENLPGVETLSDYCFKFGRNPISNMLSLTSSAARTNPQQKQVLVSRKPHTQRTASSANHLSSRLTNSMIVGEVACPYSKQFVHSKSSQYKKMNQEWRNNVYLARSKIQGLGLYAARDLEKHSMVIEYIGEVIRTEVSEIREKQYEAKNRGIYMFRLDEDRIVDATLSGGLARYINHSCNPNCVTEVVEVERELRIIIFAKRRINRGEELSYDYKFDIEDDANKLPCMCGALNCKKRMN